MQAARVASGLEQCKHFGSERAALVELLKLLPCRNDLTRQLKHPCQSHDPQHTQHLYVHIHKACEVERRDGDQVNQRVKAQCIAQTWKALARVVGVQVRGGHAHDIFSREDAHGEHIKPME